MLLYLRGSDAIEHAVCLLTVREIGSDDTPVPETLARTAPISLAEFVSTAKQITFKPRFVFLAVLLFAAV